MSNAISDNEFFEAIFKQAVIKSFEDELAAIPSREELEKLYTFSEAHNKRMEKLFRKDALREALKLTLNYTRNLAAVVIIAVALVAGLFMVNGDVRAAVSETIVEWFSQFVRFSNSAENADEFPATGWRLDYLPDGFSEIKSVSNGGTTGVIYANAENIQISWIYMESANSNTSVNNEGVAYSAQTIDGVTYYLLEAVGEGEDNSIIWELDGYRFVISSTIPLTDVQKMATSLSTSSHTDSN